MTNSKTINISTRLTGFTYELTDIVTAMPPVRIAGLEIIIEALLNTCDNSIFDTGDHYHPFYEFSVMSYGYMDYYINGESHRLTTDNNNLILLPPLRIHRRKCLLPSSVPTCFQLQIRATDSRYRKFVKNLPEILLRRGCVLPSAPKVSELLEMIFSELEHRKLLYRDRIANHINAIFILLFEQFFSKELHRITPQPEKESSGPHNDKVISLACHYIDEHLSSGIQLDNIATFCGLSKRHFCRVFTEVKGIAPGRFIIERKIDEARKMMMNPELRIKDVAAKLGFDNSSYFCRQFKQITGKSPDTYRKHRQHSVSE